MKLKKKLITSIFMVLLSGALLSACDKTEEPTETNTEVTTKETQEAETTEGTTNSADNTSSMDDSVSFTGKYIISPEEAISKLGSKEVIFIDARGAEEAGKGTIDGAIAMTWQDLSKMDGKSGDEMWGTVLPKEDLAKKLGELGLDPQKEIILFADSNKGSGNDGRILWTLKIAGYENLKMIDGGIDALSVYGIGLVNNIAKLEPITVSIDNMNYDACINTDELSTDYAKYKIVDTRAKDEYEGATKFDEAKGGHLPGAINVNYVDLFTEDGILKTNAEIKIMFEDLGIKTSDPVVTYCTAGIRSAYVQLIMEMCGYNNVKNYDESYYRWCAVNEVE